MTMETRLNKTLDVVVLYSAGHLGSAIVMNRLINMPGVRIVGVVKAQPLKLSLRGKSHTRRHLQKIGWKFAWLLFWQRCVQGLGYLLTLLPFVDNRLQPAWKIASDHGIDLHACRNVNDVACRQFISRLEPDLLISAYFPQILAPDIIALPRIGVLNIHPGWLPAYRGAMAYFWVLKNGSDRGGVSLHWIDAGIDTGKLLARRSFRLKPGATQETALIYTAVIGARLTQRIIRKLQRGETLAQEITGEDEDSAYFPMPGDQDFADYFEKHRFFRIRDVLGLMLFKKYL